MGVKRENKRKPEFKRSEHFRYARLSKGGWRKPRGIHNKMKKYVGGKPLSPSIGYSRKDELRGLHPSGYREVLVENSAQLSALDKEKEAVRISRRTGALKAKMIMEESAKLGLKILNPRKVRVKEGVEEES